VYNDGVLLPSILTFVIRELAVFALEEEVPKSILRHREGWIA
jgi:hypothetical protein